MPDKDEVKAQKKLNKAEAKAAKKSPSSTEQQLPSLYDQEDRSQALKSETMAEKQLALHRWKVIFAGLSALIALISLIVLLLR